MSEIEQAINQGKEVITHTDAVTVPGYTGAGYIILDPITGDGAYKIAGGENGGGIKPPKLALVMFWTGMLIEIVQKSPILDKAFAILGPLFEALQVFLSLKNCGIAGALLFSYFAFSFFLIIDLLIAQLVTGFIGFIIGYLVGKLLEKPLQIFIEYIKNKGTDCHE